MKKLAIVGSGPKTRDNAPYDDPTYDIWVFNEAPMSAWCKRWNGSFQMHKKDVYSGPNLKQPDYWKWLQVKRGKSVFMQEYDERVPDCIVYPINEVLALAGKKFLGMSTCYALALGLYQGYEHIEIYGVELSSTEYAYGADSWRFWVGMAIGKLGSDHVILCSGKQLFECPSYGYDGAYQIGQEYFKERATYLNNSWEAKEKSANNLKRNIERLIDRCEYDKLPDQIHIFQDAVFELGEYSGALQVAETYADETGVNADRNQYEQEGAKAIEPGKTKQIEMERAFGKIEYVWNAWKQTGAPQAKNQLLILIDAMAKAAQEAGIQNGVYTENVGYMQKHDEMVQANGGYLNHQMPPYPEMVK